MGIPVRTKTYDIKTKIGDSLKVKVEMVGRGSKLDVLYRIIRGEDRRLMSPDSVMLSKEELEQITEFLKEDFLNKEFPE